MKLLKIDTKFGGDVGKIKVIVKPPTVYLTEFVNFGRSSVIAKFGYFSLIQQEAHHQLGLGKTRAA